MVRGHKLSMMKCCGIYTEFLSNGMFRVIITLQKVLNLEQKYGLLLKKSMLYFHGVWRRHSVHGTFQPELSDRSDKIIIIL